MAFVFYLSFVHSPHMRKVYGDSLRKEAGLTKTIRNVATRNAGKHVPELQRVVEDFPITDEFSSGPRGASRAA